MPPRNWRSEILARSLVQYKSYRCSFDDVSSDTEELIKDYPSGCQPIKKRRVVESSSFLSRSDVDAALELMSNQCLTELQNADWSAFTGKKRSWQHLAKGVINRLAMDVLQLRDIKRVKEYADLLNNRLQTRRAQGIRTSMGPPRTALSPVLS